MDCVLNLQTKNLDRKERADLTAYIRLMTYRKANQVTIEKSAPKLDMSIDQLGKIRQAWLEMHPLNKKIIPMLNDLKTKRVKMCVATNNSSYFTEPFIDKFHLRPYFTKVFCPEYLNWMRKPNADFFMAIAEDLGTSVSNLVLVDDMKENIQGIKNAGGEGIIYKTPSH